jgi:hypothetical protein
MYCQGAVPHQHHRNNCPPPHPSLPQAVISSLQYNYTPANYFNVSKKRPLRCIMDTAREVLREGLPIKCIEAAFVAMYLTAGMQELSRMAIGFKSCVGGQVGHSAGGRCCCCLCLWCRWPACWQVAGM